MAGAWSLTGYGPLRMMTYNPSLDGDGVRHKRGAPAADDSCMASAAQELFVLYPHQRDDTMPLKTMRTVALLGVQCPAGTP